MREEILVIEKGKVGSHQNHIFRELYLQIFKGEIFGIIFDNILERKCLLDLIKGDRILDAGKIYLDNQKIALKESPKYFGPYIAVIERTGKLINSLTVVENILLFEPSMPRYRIDHKKYEDTMEELKKLLQIEVPRNRPVMNLTPKERVIIELIKAYVEGKKLVVLADVTGFLKSTELVDIFPLISRLKGLGMTFAVIESFEDAVFEWTDRLAFIRNGRTMGFYPSNSIKRQQIYSAIIKNEYKRKMNKMLPIQEDFREARPVLEFRHVGTEVLNNLELSIDQGEVMKICYMDDESCSHIVELLKGLRKPESGEIRLCDRIYKVNDVHQAAKKGICFVEESPYENMLFYDMSILDNLCLTLSKKMPLFWLKNRYTRSVRKFTSELLEEDVTKRKLSQLSPVKLQQIAYVKWLLYAPSVVVCMKPFTEVDIHLREVTVHMIEMLRERGIAVIIFTPNISETYRIEGDTVYMRNGKIIDEDEVYQIIYGEK